MPQPHFFEREMDLVLSVGPVLFFLEGYDVFFPKFAR